MAIKSFGVAVTVNTIAIGELTDANLSGRDVNFIDTTAHDATGRAKTFIGGLTDNGTLELTGNYDEADAGQVELRDEMGNQAAVVVTLSDATTLTFNAIVGAYNVSIPIDDKVEFTCSLKVTGTIAIA